MAGTAGLPHVIVRFFTVPRVKDARASAGWALIFIAILYTSVPGVAGFGRVNLIQTVNGPENTGRAYSDIPEWFARWETTGLIKWEDKNNDGKVFYSKTAENELTVNRDIMVLANPEIAQLPNWVIALVAAGAVAAALSTAAGLLLVISTSISHDLMKKTINPNITEKQELLYARGAAVLAILVAGYFGVNPPGFVAQVVALAFGLAASSVFPAILMGIFSKRMNTQGAVAGMIVGIASTMAYIVYFKFMGGTKDEMWFGISPEGFGTVGMILNFVVAKVVSSMTAEPPAEIQQIVEDIRIPRGAGAASSH
jgi:cation/acetate symporter